MSEFERELPPFRLAETHHGDDLQTVAARELGDANRWPELVWINTLVYPYLTDDDTQASDKVLLTGSLIRVPAPAGTPVDEPDRAQVFGRDMGLWDGLLESTDAGDFAALAGTDNLVQQLRHGIVTPRGQLRRHPGYGCLVWSLHGTVQGPTGAMLGAKYVRATLEADYRVSRVLSSTAQVDGDALRVTAHLEAIDGGAVDVTSDRPSRLPPQPDDDSLLLFSMDRLHHYVHHTLPMELGI